MLDAVREIAPADAYLGVDANCGWSLTQAVEMSAWLASREVVHIEQPLAPSDDHLLAAIARSESVTDLYR
jgi:L-alanine-DL-glutamate epimerase-like enolase superfamily enzyme